MKYETNARVEEMLEGLVEKIEKAGRQKSEEMEESRRVLGAMNRLVEAARRLEHQNRLEKAMARRVALIQERLERASGRQSRSIELKGIGDAVNKVLNGAKTTGQVMEIVAGGLQAMVETVKTVLKSQSSGARDHGPPGESKATDLAALFRPINSLLNSLVKSQSKPQSAPPQGVEQSEAVAGQQQKGDQYSPVPVVKAVPAEEAATREDGKKT